MDELPPEKRFYFWDGSSIGTLEELKRKIETIPYEQFYRHASERNNDFANWIEHVLQNAELASKLRSVPNIVETVEVLEEAIKPPTPPLAEPDFQARIEEQLFTQIAVEQPAAEPSSVAQPSPIAQPHHEQHHHSHHHHESHHDVIEQPNERLVLPSHEELELAGRLPGAPVTSSEPAHTPITQFATKPSEDHTFIVKQFIYGFILGVIAGVIIGKILSMPF